MKNVQRALLLLSGLAEAKTLITGMISRARTESEDLTEEQMKRALAATRGIADTAESEWQRALADLRNEDEAKLPVAQRTRAAARAPDGAEFHPYQDPQDAGYLGVYTGEDGAVLGYQSLPSPDRVFVPLSKALEAGDAPGVPVVAVGNGTGDVSLEVTDENGDPVDTLAIGEDAETGTDQTTESGDDAT